ncbi:urease accessory protein UreD [Streptomyces iconiensis]|uniref:Urease accessory protein UreD n=1 Tax=Streptomyces iconiensis TaxID=1384038 RepID=A0ABT6ZS94_9ACTN|nr:urease accessory protein UreD [Streptomyces iconiensis]MDJ1131931.1 urease accessory protein UreD [Streptomyces iconiensis]
MEPLSEPGEPGEPSEPTVIAVERDGDRHVARELATGTFLAPRPVASQPGVLRLALVGTRAGLLAGDALDLRVTVGPGARLELIEPAGLVAYDHRGGAATWSATVTLGEGARLCWAARPFVVSSGARVHRSVEADLARGAGMLWRELLVLGRSGERGGAVRTVTRASYDGAELLVEDLDFSDPGERELPGILHGARFLGSVTHFGTERPGDPDDPYLTRLAGPGALVRHLGPSAPPLESALDGAWTAWHDCP